MRRVFLDECCLSAAQYNMVINELIKLGEQDQAEYVLELRDYV